MADYDSFFDNNLYPPSMPTYAKAFVYDAALNKGTGRIYFNTSDFNTIGELDDYIQVIVTEQETNQSALNQSQYPAGVMWMTWKGNISTSDMPGYLYFIDISAQDMKAGFDYNKYYKVQIRFQTAGIGAPAAGTQESFITKNERKFSEWSTVCLLRAISKPTLKIRSLTPVSPESVNSDDQAPDTWQTETVSVVGRLDFANSNETEELRNYRLRAYDSRDELVADSGDIYADYHSGTNEINYTFKYLFQDGSSYKIRLDYNTTNLYEGTVYFKLLIIQGNIDPLDGVVSTVRDIENGRIGVRVKSNSTTPFAGKITIRRSSSESNFTIWEDVHTISLRNENLNYLWYDATIQSGVWYMYGAQKRDNAGNRGILTKTDAPEMIEFEHMFLTAGNTQLKIKYNPTVSSFQRTVLESKVDTLGGKYPFIKRNGATYYKQFPLGGLITAFVDDCYDTDNRSPLRDSVEVRGMESYQDKEELNHILTSKEEIWDEDVRELYDTYNANNNITPYADTIWEYNFREKVMDFLYENSIKLFRSATEGNIIVKLMDITFTPEQQLGRRVYSFNCNAYEVAEYSVENLGLFGIQDIEEKGNIDEIVSYDIEHEGKWIDTVPAYYKDENGIENTNMPVNFIDLLTEYYQKDAVDKYLVQVERMDFLRLEFISKPYLIIEGPDGPEPVNDKARSLQQDAILGHLIFITLAEDRRKEIPVVVGSEGIYEIKGKEISIVGLRFARDEEVEINYHVNIIQAEDESQILKSTVYRTQIGQEWGAFKPGEALYEKIWNKYYQTYPDYYQAVTTLEGIRVEGDPGTVIYVSEVGEKDFDRHVIGETQSLDFWDDETAIDSLYFGGTHFEKALPEEAEREDTPINKYVEMNETLTISPKSNSFEDINIALDKICPKPKKNGIYHVEIDNSKMKRKFKARSAAAAISDNAVSSTINVLGKPVTIIAEGMFAIVNEEDKEFLQEYLIKQGYTIILSNDPILATKNITTVEIQEQQKTIDYNILTTTKQKDKQFIQALADATASSNYIYFNHQWWPITDDHDVVCPVPAMVDYICEIMKGYYAKVKE